eukprot:12347876-Alexandrium_andersonii.AAC.1
MDPQGGRLAEEVPCAPAIPDAADRPLDVLRRGGFGDYGLKLRVALEWVHRLVVGLRQEGLEPGVAQDALVDGEGDVDKGARELLARVLRLVLVGRSQVLLVDIRHARRREPAELRLKLLGCVDDVADRLQRCVPETAE